MSISNAQRQRVRGLQQRKWRRKYEAFLVEGLVNVREVLNTHLEVLEVYATPEGLESLAVNIREKIARERNSSLNTHSPDQFIVGNTELERLSTQKTPHEALAVVKIPTYESYFSALEGSKENTKASRLLFLDGVSDPGNVGTLVRTAEWFGFEGILAGEGSADWYNPKTVAASRGSLFRLPHLTVSHDVLAKAFSNYQLHVADLEGSNASDYEWPQKIILAIGSESHGPSEALLQLSPKPITIQGAGTSTESLNAAIAGGILMAFATKK